MGVEIISSAPSSTATDYKYYTLYFSATAGVATEVDTGSNYETPPTFVNITVGRWALQGTGILSLRNSVISTAMAHTGTLVFLNIDYATSTNEDIRFFTQDSAGVLINTFDIMYLSVMEVVQ
jgi:hypothetical protein